MSQEVDGEERLSQESVDDNEIQPKIIGEMILAEKLYKYGMYIALATIPICFGIFGAFVLIYNYWRFRESDDEKEYEFARKSLNIAIYPV